MLAVTDLYVMKLGQRCQSTSHSAPRKLARERGRLVREQLFTELGV